MNESSSSCNHRWLTITLLNTIRKTCNRDGIVSMRIVVCTWTHQVFFVHIKHRMALLSASDCIVAQIFKERKCMDFCTPTHTLRLFLRIVLNHFYECSVETSWWWRLPMRRHQYDVIKASRKLVLYTHVVNNSIFLLWLLLYWIILSRTFEGKPNNCNWRNVIIMKSDD